MEIATTDIGIRAYLATNEDDLFGCQDWIVREVLEKAGLPNAPDLQPDKEGFTELLQKIETAFQKLGVNLEIRDVYWEEEDKPYPRIRFTLALDGKEF